MYRRHVFMSSADSKKIIVFERNRAPIHKIFNRLAWHCEEAIQFSETESNRKVGLLTEQAFDEICRKVERFRRDVAIGGVDLAIGGPHSQVSPPAGSFGFVGKDWRRTAVATDGRESLRVEWIHNHSVIVDVRLQLFIRDIGEWIHTDAIHLWIDGKNRDILPLSTFRPAQATNQAIVLSFGLQQGCRFPHVTAFLLSIGGQIKHAEFPRLILHCLIGRQGDDFQSIRVCQPITRFERFLEIDTRIDKQDGDI